MSFTNTPILTAAALVDQVNKLIGSSDSSVPVENAVNQAMLGFGARLASRFTIVFPIAGSICELDINTYGIDQIELVEQSCGHGCWKPVRWWRAQDNRIMFDGGVPLGSVRITYTESPALITQVCTLKATYNLGTTYMQIDTVGMNPILQLPTSGYVLLGDDTSPYWFEYRGAMLREPQSSSAGIDLLAIQIMPFISVTNPSHTFAAGTPVQFGVGVPSTGQLDALVKQSATYYWATKTGQCTNEDERSTAMQLMNFWTGEAEKAWRAIRQDGHPVSIRKKTPGELTWLYRL